MTVRRLSGDEVPAWVNDVLLAPGRRMPIVAVTSHPHTSHAWVNVEQLQEQLRELADVVFLETGDPTWALSEAMPPRLDVYGGALRIWWPGLTRESNPYDHRLYFVFSAADAERVVQQIVAAVREHSGPAPIRERVIPHPAVRPAAAPVVPLRAVAPEEPEVVKVTAVAPGRVEVASAARHGVIIESDLGPSMLAESAVVGCELRARALRPCGDGTWSFSVKGLLPNAWERFAAELRKGDVVTCRVQNVNEDKGLVFVDVLPGVVGLCHVRELDFGYVKNLGDFAQRGDLLAFEIRDFDAESMSLQLSRKGAHGQKPRPLPSLIEGGRPFVWQAGMPEFVSLRQRRTKGDTQDTTLRVLAHRAPTPVATDPGDPERVAAMEAELTAANEDRRELRQKMQSLRKELRAGEDRLAALQKKVGGELEPLGSETAFLLAVRLSYARQFGEDDRIGKPLQRMRVGPHFLASLRALDGIDLDKVLEVCAQVAANVAHTIPARDVHQLRAGSRGAGSRTRARDGAQAWRCALQLKTPSARRLHWWNVPGEGGATIEFASAAVHDEFDIPE